MVWTEIEYTDGEKETKKTETVEEALEFIKEMLVDEDDYADKITIDLTDEN